MIVVDGVSKRYESQTGVTDALFDVSLQIPSGNFWSLIGPSGCGKSTLLAIIGGLNTPSSGRVLIDGSPIGRPDPSVCATVFQDASLFPWLPITRNVTFGLEMAGVARPEREERASHYLDMVGLSGFEKAYPSELSGGMQQRAAIARAFAMEPRILLMDEPFGALDEQTRLLLGEELLRIWEQGTIDGSTRRTVLFVTHSLVEAVYLSDVVVVMSARPGRILDTIEVTMPRSERRPGQPELEALRGRIWDLLSGESLRAMKPRR